MGNGITKIMDGKATVDVIDKIVEVHEHVFALDLYSAMQDTFDQPGFMEHSAPFMCIGADSAWVGLREINGWTLKGKDKVDYRWVADRDDEPRPNLVHAKIIYSDPTTGETEEVQPPLSALSYLSYFDNGDRACRQLFDSVEEMDRHLFIDPNSGLRYYVVESDDNQGERYLLHNAHSMGLHVAGDPSGEGKFWRGRLHSLDSWASHKKENGRWNSKHFVFGIQLDEEVDPVDKFLKEFEPYFLKLEKYLEVNVDPEKSVWTIESFDNLIESIEGGWVKIYEDDDPVSLFEEEDKSEPTALGIGATIGFAAIGMATAAFLKRQKVEVSQKVVEQIEV